MVSKWSSLVVGGLIGALGVLFGSEDKEPPLQIVIEIGDQKIDAEIGKVYEVDLGVAKIPLKVTAKPTRRFAFEGMSFEYPAHMSFTSDRSDPGTSIWNLDGSDCMIMIQRFSGVGMGGPELFSFVVEATAQSYGGAPTETLPIEMVLGGKKVAGTRLIATIGEIKLYQDFFQVESPDASWILLIQDSLDDYGNETEETRVARDLLSKTLFLDDGN